jgi:branched-chain amino acid aminotransferase
MSAIVWADGQIHKATDNIINPMSHGFTLGDGCFETIAVREGRPFALTRHLARLQYSLDRLGLGRVDPAYLTSGVRDVLAAGGGQLARLRITVAAGPGPLGLRRTPGALNVVVMGAPGVTSRSCIAVRVPWKRNERSPLTGVKTTSYAENVMMLLYAEERGADEAIMSNTHGHLCEGTGTNVFVERHGEVITPPLASGCLPGIARGLALEWGAAAGLPVRVAQPGEMEMGILDEVVQHQAAMVVTSVTRGVQPVSRLDGVDTVPGPLLAQLRDVYESRASVDPDPAPPRPTSG